RPALAPAESSGATKEMGGSAFGRPQAFPPQGGRWPEGPDEGADERGVTPVGTLISLALLDSFPLEGGSLFAWGATTRRALPLRLPRSSGAKKGEAAPCGRPQSLPSHRGEGGPKGRMRGRARRASPFCRGAHGAPGLSLR